VLLKNDKMMYYNENNQLDNIIKTKDTLSSTMAALKMELFNSKKIINDNSVVLNIKTINFEWQIKIYFTLCLDSFFVLTQLFISFTKVNLQNTQQ
jgi:mevalonate pyrophosphate decarboxylase